MFHPIPPAIRDRMRYLEEVDARDRTNGTPKSHRLRQIPAETGKFLAFLAACAPPGRVLEAGSNGGYSTHAAELARFLEKASSDERTNELVVPIDKGLLLCRKS